MSNIEFHRLEEYDEGPLESAPKVICSFNTDRFGYVQVKLSYRKLKSGGGWKFESLLNEPDMNMFTAGDTRYIRRTLHIIWRMVYEVPAKKNRFRKS